MDVIAADYTLARDLMVDGQVRPNQVADQRILDAMRRLPRERFLPPALAGRAYIEEDVKLPGGRVLIRPLVISRLVQLCTAREGERTLVIGAGTGYGSALLAACGAAVTALEEDEALLQIAGPVLAEFAPQVRVVRGPLAAGFAEQGPWDLILIEGAVAAIPDGIGAQLHEQVGRLITIVVSGGRVGKAVVAERTAAGLKTQAAFDAATAILPQFAPKPGFVF